MNGKDDATASAATDSAGEEEDEEERLQRELQAAKTALCDAFFAES